MKRFYFLMAVALLFSCVVYGHHSFMATFNTDKTVTIEGKIKLFLLRNPHSFLQITVMDKHGNEQNWTIEWAGADQLGEEGITRDSLKVGDAVVITGNPARDTAHQYLRMVRVKRASDGLNWGFRQGQFVE